MEVCGLCGHEITEGLDPKCGAAGVWRGKTWTRLCHADDHSCYHRWTVYGDRPANVPLSVPVTNQEMTDGKWDDTVLEWRRY